jgi:hypothetical protein
MVFGWHYQQMIQLRIVGRHSYGFRVDFSSQGFLGWSTVLEQLPLLAMPQPPE